MNGSDLRLCEGPSGKRIRVVDARCTGCEMVFVAFGIHSHESETGEIFAQPIPCVVDAHCFRTAAGGECPNCASQVLVATEPWE